MTFKSLFIESHPNRESAHATYVPGVSVNRQVVCSLNAYTFPASAVRFATEHGLTVDYVDNAWARIALNGCLLKRFLAYGGETEPVAHIDEQGWYVLTEEEF